MSKSKKNVVDPEEIMGGYGADAARLFILSDSPPDRDLEWTEAGIEGAWRYINRIYRLVAESLPMLSQTGAAKPQQFDDKSVALRQMAHRAALHVGKDIEAFAMNKAVARLRELSNALIDFKPDGESAQWALREGLEIYTRCVNPMLPHLAEELWEMLGHKTLLVDTPWAESDPALVVSDTVTVAVQVNGKLRASITLPKDIDAKEAEKAALAEDGVQRALDGKSIKKIVVVPNRIVNIVAG
jgi:leucyl-tRNA synthetase